MRQRELGQIVFVGLGLHDDQGISLSGLQEVKASDKVFAEFYTSLLPGFSLERFESLAGKKLTLLSRRDLEDLNGQAVLEAAEKESVALLVPGDPMIATTHVTLRIEAQKRGVKTRIVHGASILSAAAGLSGLHSYKFGKSVTVPFPDENTSATPYSVIAENQKRGLHTLCLLDIKAAEKRYLSINEALGALLSVQAREGKEAVTRGTLAVGIGRAGSQNPTVKAECAGRLLEYDFEGPPQCLIFPGKLHFMEAEALIVLAGAPESIRETAE
jgi:diphthine synthase